MNRFVSDVSVFRGCFTWTSTCSDIMSPEECTSHCKTPPVPSLDKDRGFGDRKSIRPGKLCHNSYARQSEKSLVELGVRQKPATRSGHGGER
mgnify:FL=1